ncbi:RICIN domain-containing protein [Streptomyces actinomycinicus]|uniref:RICIN domain-containing protein n=1 Tax=Streptomyces actinomycinicus TaxID=1695166 RepID=UPI0027D9E3B1|nr:RICIN domain-containing protein [Streptomyces actinomycinicus]
MQSPHPPRPPYPPLPGPVGGSDRTLVARLGGPDDARHPAVALLLARHWRATCDYAVVCLATAGPSAQLVATAAFHQVLARMTGGVIGGALRPQLLVAARDIVRTWAADDAACVTLPELRKTTGGRGLRATNPGTPESRQLAARAFRALPGAAQCLLWHTEVEAEPIYIPAGLLGIDTAAATTSLEQAREQFRAGCVRAHRELAPARECRFYNRLLDVPIRRGGDLLPEVRRHLTVCGHCRYAADQLGRFDGGLPLLLAETVLGWGARRYVDARPGRCDPAGHPPPQDVPQVAGGRHRAGADHGNGRGADHGTGSGADHGNAPGPEYGNGSGADHRLRGGPGLRHRKAVAVGVGLTSLALLATVLVVRSWSDDNGVAAAPGATWGAPAGNTTTPGGIGAHSATSPSAASVGESAEIAHGSLRALGSGRCLDVDGGRVAGGAGLRLAPCSSAVSQQWSYRDDGLLRSAADPALCVAADPGTERVVLDGCVVHAGEVSYDLTVRGEILLRWHKGLALTPGSGRSARSARSVSRVGVAERDGSREQRWVLAPGAGAVGVPRSGAGPEGEGARPGTPGSPRTPGSKHGSQGPHRAQGLRGPYGGGGANGPDGSVGPVGSVGSVGSGGSTTER